MSRRRRIPIGKIDPDPNQPRKIFDAAELELLADTIAAADGLIQPITLRPHGRGRFYIEAGERRWRAHGILVRRGLRKFAYIDCEVVDKNTPPAHVRARQIIENMARADLQPLEEAHAFAQFAADFDLSPEDVAQRLGLSPFRVRWRLSLLNLAPAIARMVESGHLDRQQALEVARLDRHADQLRLVQMINRGELQGWKAVRNAADAILQGTTAEDLFGESAPVVSAGDVATLRTMERKIETIAGMVAAGWRNGECIVANKVCPERAGVMADKLAAIRLAVSHMERELRNTSAQVKIAIAG
jgi:ParB family chromosome partitioning protein